MRTKTDIVSASGSRWRRRWSRESKTALVEQWSERGMSRAELCRVEGLYYSRFLDWVKDVTDAEDAPHFVEVGNRYAERPYTQGPYSA